MRTLRVFPRRIYIGFLLLFFGLSVCTIFLTWEVMDNVEDSNRKWQHQGDKSDKPLQALVPEFDTPFPLHNLPLDQLQEDTKNIKRITVPITPTARRRVDSIAVLVMACNRPSIARSLDTLLKYKPKDKFPIIVSQDCDHAETSNVIDKYGSQVLHIKQPDQSNPTILPHHAGLGDYYKIARHYRWALNQVFNVLLFEQAIIIEDDLEIAPDFFDYFQAFLPVLQADKKLMCISAWNDNGKSHRVEDSHIFYRTDFFPGLGWMLLKSFWQEIEPIWPATFWDDWLRHRDRHKGRGCIRPEISRTLNFGRFGVSNGLFFDSHVGRIELNTNPVQFTGYNRETGDLTPLHSLPSIRASEERQLVDVRLFFPDIYDDSFLKQVYELSTPVTTFELKDFIEGKMTNTSFLSSNPNLYYLGSSEKRTPVPETMFSDVASVHYCGRLCRRRFRIEYKLTPGVGKYDLGGMAQELLAWELMDDIREDAARTAYKGVVSFKLKYIHMIDGLRGPEEYFMIYIAPTKQN